MLIFAWVSIARYRSNLRILEVRVFKFADDIIHKYRLTVAENPFQIQNVSIQSLDELPTNNVPFVLKYFGILIL